METPKITKSAFMALYNKGLKTSEIAAELSEAYELKITQADVKTMATGFGVNLKNKPRTKKVKFVLENDYDIVNASEGYVNAAHSVVLP